MYSQSIPIVGVVAGILAVAGVCAALLVEDTARAWVSPLVAISGCLAALGFLCGVRSRKSRPGKLAILLALSVFAGVVGKLLYRA
jgi:hypothetical protein